MGFRIGRGLMEKWTGAIVDSLDELGYFDDVELREAVKTVVQRTKKLGPIELAQIGSRVRRALGIR